MRTLLVSGPCNTLLSRIEAREPLGDTMQDVNGPEWRPLAIVGIILLINTTFIQLSTPGPWNSDSFTLGALGSVALVLLYVSWYRFTFKRKGLIPWIDLWNEPATSAKKELISSLVVLSLAWAAGNHMQDLLPRPTGLVLSLVGFLMLSQSIYVLLSVGPLAED